LSLSKYRDVVELGIFFPLNPPKADLTFSLNEKSKQARRAHEHQKLYFANNKSIRRFPSFLRRGAVPIVREVRWGGAFSLYNIYVDI